MTPTLRKALQVIVSAAVVTLVPANLWATTITFNLTGTIDSEAFNGLSGPPLAFAGSFTFDSTAVNGAPSGQGSYDSVGAQYGIHIADFGFGPFDAFSFINIGVIPSVGSYTVTATTTGGVCPAGGGSLCIDANFTGAVLADTTQPLVPPGFAFGTIDISDQTNYEYQGTIRTLTAAATTPPAVPEPGTLVLVLTGLSTAVARRRSSRNRGS